MTHESWHDVSISLKLTIPLNQTVGNQLFRVLGTFVKHYRHYCIYKHFNHMNHLKIQKNYMHLKTFLSLDTVYFNCLPVIVLSNEPYYFCVLLNWLYTLPSSSRACVWLGQIIIKITISLITNNGKAGSNWFEKTIRKQLERNRNSKY